MIPEDAMPALQGIFPSVIATCALDGTPNITYLSQVWYMDPNHVALSFQFFNKTIRNIGENPHATVEAVDPRDLSQWELKIQFDHAETEGPLFDEMDIQLEAIASMTGMSGVFELKAAHVYKVKSVRHRTEMIA